MIVAGEYVPYVMSMEQFKISATTHLRNIEINIGFVGLRKEKRNVLKDHHVLRLYSLTMSESQLLVEPSQLCGIFTLISRSTSRIYWSDGGNLRRRA
jgi:hypothetical protein